MDAPIADQNLLYGVTALRMGLISRDALITALCAWTPAEGWTLGQILIEQGSLDPADHLTVEHAVRRFVERRDQESSRMITEFDFEIDGQAAGSSDPDRPDSCRQAPIETDRGSTTVLGPAPPLSDEGPSSAASPVPNGAAIARGDRFRPIRLHAKGGLGEVYMAWDAELGRIVALKEIRPEHAQNPRLRARFLREAEINGSLEHPGVVPVYGLGRYADGRPYYAMRFVQGETLQEAIDHFHNGKPGPESKLTASQWALKIRPFLGRFLDVCDAIAYAHSRNVIHRDIKPSNILLGKYNETIIIDWGLAKFAGQSDGDFPEIEPHQNQGQDRNQDRGPNHEQDTIPIPSPTASHVTDGELPPTIAGETLGSPPYMSPEQALGKHSEIGRPSDIYSLGATLYAILTGRPPVTDRKTTEILAKVCRGDVQPPSDVNPNVPKALEAICQKAMQLRPTDRYETAEALARDIEHWLADEPVSVHEDSSTTRLLRWSRHHKPLVSASLALLLAALVGLTATTAIVGEQRDRAERAQVRAEIAHADAEIARQQAEDARQAAREDLRGGLAFVNELVTLGDRQLIAQLPASARGRILGPALEFVRRFRGRQPDDPAVQIQTALIARRLANLNHLTGDFDDADRFHVEAISLLSDQHRQFPDPRHADLLAESLLDLASVRLLRGQAADAEGLIKRALTFARRNADAMPDDQRYQRTLSRALSHLGAAKLAQGRDSEALDHGQEAVRCLEPLAERALPTVREQVERGRYLALTDQIELVIALDRLAEALGRTGSVAEAEQHLRRAHQRMEAIADRFQDHSIADINHFHAWIAIRRSRFSIERPDTDLGTQDVLRLLDEAILRLESLNESDNEIWPFRATLADALAVRARARHELEDLDGAEADARAAQSQLDMLIHLEGAIPDHHSQLGEVLERLALLTLSRDPSQRHQARTLLDRAIEAQKAALAINPLNSTYLNRKAGHLDQLNKLDSPPDSWSGTR